MSKLLENPSIDSRIIIGSSGFDLGAVIEAEKIIQERHPEIDIITGFDGNKLTTVKDLVNTCQKIQTNLEKKLNKSRQENIENQKRFQKEKEEVRNTAYKTGYDNGKKEGLEIGERQACDNLGNLMQDIIKQREVLYNEARRKIPQLIIDIARKITFDAVKIDPRVSESIVAGVIDELVDKSKLKVKVHPEHLSVIEQQIERIKSSSASIKDIIFEADRRVRYGGCYIETPTGDIDARVETQMEIIASALSVEEDTS